MHGSRFFAHRQRPSMTGLETQAWRIRRARYRRYAAFSTVALLVATVGLLTSCSNGAQSQAATGAESAGVPVMVAKAMEKTVPIQVQVIGNGEAYTTVNVKAQVDGLLQRAYFREGED